jgi:hypothetical protein
MVRKMRRYYEVADEDVDERGVVRDGGRVHVPIYLTDGWRAPLLHKPGPVRLTDDVVDIREQARAERAARMKNAWRSPSSIGSDDDFGLAPPKRNVARAPMANDGQPDEIDPREAALADRAARKANAWKTSARR